MCTIYLNNQFILLIEMSTPMYRNGIKLIIKIKNNV